MRPIDKGPVPLRDDGTPKVVNNYKDWRRDLLKRIGPYCCYCNIPLYDSPQVEHVIAQDIDGQGHRERAVDDPCAGVGASQRNMECFLEGHHAS